MKWMSGGTKRQCDRALAVPAAKPHDVERRWHLARGRLLVHHRDCDINEVLQ
jgi:hypothetical protein